MWISVQFSFRNYIEALADEKVEVAKPVAAAPVNVNKWDGEDEDDVKVSLFKLVCHSSTVFDYC